MEQLHTLSGEEQRLCPGFECRTTLVLKHEAVQDLAEWRLIRSDGDDVVSLLTQRAGKGCDLGALACTVEPFERDEKATPCAHAGQYSPTVGPLTQTVYSEGRSMTSRRLGSSPVLRAVSACCSTS